MTELSLDVLTDKVDNSEVALVRIAASYQPGAGVGSRVFPPTFPVIGNESPYLIEARVRSGEKVEAAVLDQVPSQANRAEEAIKSAQQNMGVKVPLLRLTHDGATSVVITGFDAPHRIFDAYWRDSLLDGVKFDKTELGKSLQAASLDDARPLLLHDPGSISYGSWNSHRKGRQAKFPRLYASEIVGWNPVEGKRKAGRMDPLNLVGTRDGDGDEWNYSATGAKSKNGKLSEIGHGNVAPNSAHGGVTITEATRFATVSLTALSRVRFGSWNAEQQHAARVLLAAFALLGDRLAFGGAGLWLRSGCDLVVEEETMEWIGRGGVVEPLSLTVDGAVQLYEAARVAAQDVGVELALEPVELTPSPSLAKAIDYSLTKAESPDG